MKNKKSREELCEEIFAKHQFLQKPDKTMVFDISVDDILMGQLRARDSGNFRTLWDIDLVDDSGELIEVTRGCDSQSLAMRIFYNSHEVQDLYKKRKGMEDGVSVATGPTPKKKPDKKQAGDTFGVNALKKMIEHADWERMCFQAFLDLKGFHKSDELIAAYDVNMNKLKIQDPASESIKQITFGPDVRRNMSEWRAFRNGWSKCTEKIGETMENIKRSGDNCNKR